MTLFKKTVLSFSTSRNMFDMFLGGSKKKAALDEVDPERRIGVQRWDKQSVSDWVVSKWKSTELIIFGERICLNSEFSFSSSSFLLFLIYKSSTLFFVFFFFVLSPHVYISTYRSTDHEGEPRERAKEKYKIVFATICNNQTKKQTSIFQPACIYTAHK